MKPIKTSLLVFAGAALALLVVTGSAQAQAEAPTGFTKVDMGVDGFVPLVEVNASTVYGASVSSSLATVLSSTDGGNTWTFNNITTSPDQANGWNFSTITHKDGRTVVSWIGSALTMHVAYSDDLNTWSYGNNTYVVGSIRRQAICMASTTHWYSAVGHGDAGNIRVVIRETTNAGASWSTLTNTAPITTKTIDKSWNIGWNDGCDYVAYSFHWGNAAGDRKNEIRFLNRDNTNNAAQILESGGSSPEGHISQGYYNGMWYYASALEAGGIPSNSTVRVKNCKGHTLPTQCDAAVSAGTSFVVSQETASPPGPNRGAIIGDGAASVQFITHAGVTKTTAGGSNFDNQYGLIDLNGTSATVEDLVNLNDNPCAIINLNGTSPIFTCDGFAFVASSSFFTPTVTSDAVDVSNSAVSVKTDWGGGTNFLVYSHNSENKFIRQLGPDLGFVNSHGICTAITGWQDRDVVKGNLFVAPNGNIWTMCRDDSTTALKWAYAPISLTATPVTVDNFQFSGTGFWNVCEFVVITNDIASALSCNNDAQFFCDPGLAPEIPGGTDCQEFGGTNIPQPFRPDHGQGITANDQWAFVGTADDVLWFVRNDEDGTGEGPAQMFNNEAYKSGTVCGKVVYTSFNPPASLTRTAWDNGYASNATSLLVRDVGLQFDRMVPSKDCQYIYAATSTRIYVIDADTLEILAKSPTTTEVDAALPLTSWTDYDVDAGNNYLYAAINTSDNGLGDRIYRFPIYNYTSSLAGPGVPGSPNPTFMNPFWEDYDTLEDVTGTDDPRATTSTGTGSGQVPVGGGPGTVFGDVTQLDNSFGVAGSGGLFVGLLLIFAFAGAGFFLGNSTGMAAVGGLLGLSFATFLGFIPIWVVVLLAMAGAAVLAFRHQRGAA